MSWSIDVMYILMCRTSTHSVGIHDEDVRTASTCTSRACLGVWGMPMLGINKTWLFFRWMKMVIWSHWRDSCQLNYFYRIKLSALLKIQITPCRHILKEIRYLSTDIGTIFDPLFLVRHPFKRKKTGFLLGQPFYCTLFWYVGTIIYIR